MSHDRENSALDVLGDANTNAALLQQIADLQEQLAKYEPDKGEVLHPSFKGEVPRYRLNSACYLDDTLFEEGTEIDFLDTPNTEMVPLNEPARARMQAYLEQLMEGQQAVSRANGRQTGPLILDKAELIAAMSQDARNTPAKVSVSMPEARGDVFGMPHLPQAKAANKKAGKAKRASVVSVKPPAPPAKVKTAPDRVLGSDMANTYTGNQRG